ncbi:hypothetical protein BH10PLA1_BH10PLA1_12170 [soil metagenome]
MNSTPTRFVVLRHEGIPQPHFDVMFERSAGSALASWRSDVWPIEQPCPLDHLDDHRREYLEYEGPLTNDRGHVRRVAAGFCVFHEETPFVIVVRFTDPAAGGLLLLKRDGAWHALPQ